MSCTWNKRSPPWLGHGLRAAATRSGMRSFGFLARFAGAFVLVLLGSLILVAADRRTSSVPPVRFRLQRLYRLGPGTAGVRRRRFDMGTLVTSVVAMVIAVPPASGIAFHLTELAPRGLRCPVRTAVELLAAVPLYHLRHVAILLSSPPTSQYIQPFVIDFLDGIPVLEDLFAGPPFGTGIFTAALILAVMVIPFDRRHHARRIRNCTGGLQGVRPTGWAAPPGRSCARSAPPYRGPRRSAASCWASAVHWARPWL